MQKSALLKERLLFRRNRLGLTQAELAEKSGVSLRSISNFEGGELPTLESLFKLANALGVKPGYFLGDEIEELAELTSLRESHPAGRGVYSHLEPGTLMNNLADLAQKLPKLLPQERKHVLGNLRAILYELEQRDLAGKLSDRDLMEMASGSVRREQSKSSSKTPADEIAEAVEEEAAVRSRRKGGSK